ncbi:hypothetical protein MED121_04298 [Marinomonas sp. MED121]|uniref:restriction endonuclease n=1 Tax=Marinomonas sp. MED121 TaxID=314277 RepID=UPI000068FACC|nr:restriction endonuclease [Marinomonas sp. MED121]EAQ63963.1 hypothetical protein MED121_04298 [Marinomonas sp. MED121]
MSTNLKDVVSDWGGFEEFVKEIHEGEGVIVERDVTLTGLSGAPRQIDVHVTHSKGPYKYSTLIECKHWKNKVKRQQVENMYASMEDLGASKGVIFTTSGYQSGAEIYAKAKNIDIYVVRDLNPEEWGKPGRAIEFYIQISSKSILSIDCQNTMVSKVVGSDEEHHPELSLNFGVKDKTLQEIESLNQETGELEIISAVENQVVSSHKEKGATLEEYLEVASSHGQKSINEKSFLINGGADCTRYFQVNVEMPFKDKGEMLMVISKGQLVYIPKIVMAVGVKIHQFKFAYDRGSNLLYALAIEDCIGSKAFAVSKRKDRETTNWLPLSGAGSPKQNDSLVNGSIMKVTTSGFFDPSEVEGLKEVVFKEKPIKSEHNLNGTPTSI